MLLRTRYAGDTIVAEPVGEIDGRTAPVLEESLLSLVEISPNIVINMAGITYLSSAGLRILLLLYRQVKERPGEIVLSNLPEAAADTMRNTGFMDLFEVFPTVEAALAAVGQQP